MDRKTAEEFWSTYFGLIMHEGADTCMGNPFKEFIKEARIGTYDALTDDEYHMKYQQAEEISAFWNGRNKRSAGQVFAEALSRTPLSYNEQKEILSTLMDASERITYKSLNASVNEDGEMAFDMDPVQMKQSKKDADCEDLDFETAYEETPFDEEEFRWTPRLIYDYIGEYVHGQYRARQAASILVYNHLQGRRRNMILAGPTGCGKTEIWRSLSKKFDFIKIVNGPQLACDGWKGSYHIKDIFLEELQKGRNPGHLLVVIDEADKLFEPAVASGGTDFSKMIQNEFLKIMDGDSMIVGSDDPKKKSVTIDCSGVSFVFCGSFETLLQNRDMKPSPIGFSRGEAEIQSEPVLFTEEDLVQYGNVRREIAGRIQQIAEVDMLSEEDFEYMMTSRKKMSPIRQLEKMYDIHMKVDAVTRKYLAHKAVESKLGCRYIRSRLQVLLDDQMFDDPDQKEFQLSVKAAQTSDSEASEAISALAS